MLIDLHAHTQGMSVCCKAPSPVILQVAKDNGIDGIALTNHYVRQNKGDHKDYAQRYVDEYYYTKECGDAMDAVVIYGMEVTMDAYDHAHILIYGIDPAFTLEHPLIFSYTMEELYAAVKAVGGMVVQAHPFRGNRSEPVTLACLDGLELNSHPSYNGTFARRLTEIAHANGLILTSGGDYHHDVPYRAYCGVHLPESITDTHALCKYLLTTEEVDLQYQEPNCEERIRTIYKRHP